MPVKRQGVGATEMQVLRDFAELRTVRSRIASAPTNIPNIRGVASKETFREVQAIPQTELELTRWKVSKARVNWSKWK